MCLHPCEVAVNIPRSAACSNEETEKQKTRFLLNMRMENIFQELVILFNVNVI